MKLPIISKESKYFVACLYFGICLQENGSKIVKKVVDRLRKVAYAVIEEGVFYFCFVCLPSVPLPLATLTDLVAIVAMKQVSDPGLVNLGEQRLKRYTAFRSRVRVIPSRRLTFKERSALFLLGG